MLVQQIEPQLVRPPVAVCGATAGSLVEDRTFGFGTHVLAYVGGRVRAGKRKNARTLLQTQRSDAIFEKIPNQLFGGSGTVAWERVGKMKHGC
jgi:hypothetical protein